MRTDCVPCPRRRPASNSYPTTLTWEQEKVPALLWTTHAGQETGNALADVLFGDVNPSGRLTQTWYRSVADLPSILEYDNIKHDRTYQYFTGEVLYPFGHGLRTPPSATAVRASSAAASRSRSPIPGAAPAPRSCSSTPGSATRGSSSR
ncbi:glycoside hydrolase family 3 protein [Streptomyces sp. NPDC096176]|uniref:glycoside hydrolase family 3 protein n=1 Tax=Streptomyces sp. NPDC096176 TaxID=3366079 RepID=UPI0037FB2A5B